MEQWEIEEKLNKKVRRLFSDLHKITDYDFGVSLKRETLEKYELLKVTDYGQEWDFNTITIRFNVMKNPVIHSELDVMFENNDYFGASKTIHSDLTFGENGGTRSIAFKNIDFKFFLVANYDKILEIAKEKESKRIEKVKAQMDKERRRKEEALQKYNELAEELLQEA